MSKYSYMEIVKQATLCYNNTKKEHRNGISSKWAYYISKAILKPNYDVGKIKLQNADNPTGNYISRGVQKKDYLEIIERYIKYVEKHHRIPNYVTIDKIKVKPRLYTAFVSYILYKYHRDKKLPAKQNINSKIYKKPVETTNEVYNYFIDVFGSFGNTIDGALSKIAGHGYGYYYDDIYTNHEAINRMKNGKGVNCTDSCQVFYNIMQQLIALKKYKKVECLHVKCQGGDGHVRLRITLNDGTKIYRDPAAVLDSGNVTHNWCMNGTIIAIDPNWFMANLNR